MPFPALGGMMPGPSAPSEPTTRQAPVPATSLACYGYVLPEVWHPSEGEMRWTGEIGVGRGYKAHTTALSLGAYVYNLVYRFGLRNATEVNTPLTPGAILQP